MQGHVRQRTRRDGTPGNWQVIVYAGRDPITGKPQYLSGSAPNKRAAMELRNQLLAKAGESSAPRVGTDATVGELWEEYMDTAGPPKKNSRGIYEGVWRRDLAPTLADMPTRDVRGRDLNRIYKAMLERGLEPSTIRKAHTVASAMFTYGIKNEWLVTNPARNASPPPMKKKKVQPAPLEQILALLAATEGTPFGLYVLVSAALGTRRSETLGLQWGDIDFATGAVSIGRRITVIDGGVEVEDFTKTDEERTVALDAGTLEALRNQLVTAQANAALAEVALPREAFIFTDAANVLGTRTWHPSWATHRMMQLRRDLGLSEKLTPQGLRHYVGTSLVAAGEDVRTVAERLGNSAAVLLKHYAGFVPARDREAAEKMGRLLHGDRT